MVRRLSLLLLGLLLLPAIGGCDGGKRTEFYTLAPAAPQNSAGVGSGGAPAVAVGPVSLPAYLDRTQIVTQVNANRVELGELHAWVEPLDSLVARILVENLSALLGASEVHAWRPQGGLKSDLRVEVEVLRFDTDALGASTLVARWLLFRGGDDADAFRTERIVAQAGQPSDYEARVAAMSSALAEFSRRVAEAVAQAPPPKSDPRHARRGPAGRSP
jgi:uncharacterized lipoprotein YmbA